MLKPEHPEQTDCPVCSGFAAQTKETRIGIPSAHPRSNEMLRLVRVQLRKAENRIPVDGTHCARHRCVVSRLVDVATVRFLTGDEHPNNRGGCPSLQNLVTNWPFISPLSTAGSRHPGESRTKTAAALGVDASVSQSSG
jgi:hypothetical protein